MKKILAGISILFVLLALAAAVAPYLMDLDRYKGVVLGALKPYLSREVDFEHMELTVLTGLGVKIEGLTVSENPSFGDGDFLRLENLEVRVRMIPLLRKQMKIRRALLRRPAVRLARNAGGEFNFSDLFKGGNPPDDGSNQETLPVTGVSSHTGNVQGALAVSGINDLEVQEGRVTYQDENLFPGAAPVLIDRLDLRAQDLSLQKTATLELAAGLACAPEQNLHLSARTEPVDGTVAWQGLRMSVKIKIDSLPVGLVPAVWLAGLPAKPASGDLTLTLEAHGSFAEQIQSAVDLACKGLVLEVPRGGEMIERSGAFELAVSQRGTYDPAQQQVTIESGTVVLNGGTVLVKGFVG